MFLGDKGETLEVFKTFARRAQREYNSPIVKIRSDNGTEFKNMKIEEWCDEEGIMRFCLVSHVMMSLKLSIFNIPMTRLIHFIWRFVSLCAFSFCSKRKITKLYA